MVYTPDYEFRVQLGQIWSWGTSIIDTPFSLFYYLKAVLRWINKRRSFLIFCSATTNTTLENTKVVNLLPRFVCRTCVPTSSISPSASCRRRAAGSLLLLYRPGAHEQRLKFANIRHTSCQLTQTRVTNYSCNCGQVNSLLTLLHFPISLLPWCCCAGR